MKWLLVTVGAWAVASVPASILIGRMIAYGKGQPLPSPGSGSAQR